MARSRQDDELIRQLRRSTELQQAQISKLKGDLEDALARKGGAEASCDSYRRSCRIHEEEIERLEAAVEVLTKQLAAANDQIVELRFPR